MKKLLLFIPLFSFSTLFAQDWAPFKTTDTLRHFISNMGIPTNSRYQIQTVVQKDTSSSSNLHLKLFRSGFSKMPFIRNNYQQIIKGQILGDTLRVSSDSSVFTSIDQFGYRLYFPHHYFVNQQFMLASSFDSYIKANVDSIYVDSINGGVDSVVSMHLTAYDTSNTINSNHDFHGATVIVSKYNGLIKAVDFTDLTGRLIVEQFFMGETTFTERDKFDLTKGDEYHYQIDSGGITWSTHDHIVKVIEDTVINNVRNLTFEDSWVKKYSTNPTLNIDTFIRTFSDNQIAFNDYSMIIEDTIALWQSKTITISEFTICTYCYFDANKLYYREREYDIFNYFIDSDSIVGYYASNSHNTDDTKLLIGIDYEYNRYQSLHGIGYMTQTKSILYLKKGSQTWGTPLNLAVGLENNDTNEEVVIFYPNPTTESITIKNTKGIKTIELYNIHGQIVKELRPNKQEFIMLEIEGPSGLYFLRFQMQDGSSQTSKVLKN